MSRGYNRPTTRGSLIQKDKSEHYQVQNVKKSRVYVFGDADIQEDEIVEYEMSEVRSRKAPKQIENEDKEPLYFDREITEGDSLQGISLQYGCPVAELKRINNMMQDQDFFARRVIKVPIKRHSFLTELITQNENEKRQAKARSNGAAGFVDHDEEAGKETDQAFIETDNESNCDFSDPETQRLIIRTLSINDAFHSQSNEAKKFLKNMDKDLSEIRNSTRLNRSSLSEVVSVLTDRTIQPMQSRKTKVNWTDCGITWKSIIISFTIIGILVPLVIFLYYNYGKKS